MLSDDALMTRAALYNMGRGRRSTGESGFRESEIYQYVNERRAALTSRVRKGWPSSYAWVRCMPAPTTNDAID